MVEYSNYWVFIRCVCSLCTSWNILKVVKVEIDRCLGSDVGWRCANSLCLTLWSPTPCLRPLYPIPLCLFLMPLSQASLSHSPTPSFSYSLFLFCPFWALCCSPHLHLFLLPTSVSFSPLYIWCVCHKYWQFAREYQWIIWISHTPDSISESSRYRTATHCNMLQHATTHSIGEASRYRAAMQCNSLQHTATHSISESSRYRTPTHCNTLQHTATHCNALQHTASVNHLDIALQHNATHCNTLQHTATHSISESSGHRTK